MKKILLAVVCALVQVACAPPAAEQPPATVALVSSELATATPAPLPTTVAISPSLTPTSAPTATAPKPTSTRTVAPATRRPTARPSATVTASPSPVSGPAQACANLSARGMSGIYVVDIVPDPALVWDGRPHLFRVSVCNTIPSSTPQGRYRIFLHFPTSTQGHEESLPTPADLKAGMNTVVVGPWIPGLENHRARCATKATAEVEVGYNDLPDPIYRPLPWPDGKTRTYLPVACGGNFA